MMSSALPCGTPSTTSNSTTSPSSFRPASKAKAPPIWPSPISAIFLRAMGMSSSWGGERETARVLPRNRRTGKAGGLQLYRLLLPSILRSRNEGDNRLRKVGNEQDAVSAERQCPPVERHAGDRGGAVGAGRLDGGAGGLFALDLGVRFCLCAARHRPGEFPAMPLPGPVGRRRRV